MRLSHIFAVLDGFNFTQMHLAEVKLLKLTLLAAQVIYRSASELVMRYSVSHDSVLLSDALLLTNFTDLGHVSFVMEKRVVMVRGCTIVNCRLKTHFEVRCAH